MRKSSIAGISAPGDGGKLFLTACAACGAGAVDESADAGSGGLPRFVPPMVGHAGRCGRDLYNRGCITRRCGNRNPCTASTGVPEMFDLILFDLDGTLIDSVGAIAAATNAVLVKRGFLAASVHQVRNWVGYGARETLVRALAHASGREREAVRASGAELEAAQADFAAAYDGDDAATQRAFPGAVDALRTLKAAGVKLALVTNKEQALTCRVLPLCGLDGLFDPVVAGDTLPKRKPDPFPVYYCLEKLGVPVARALFVGDSPVDVATAKAAGVCCWVVPWGYSGGRPIAEQNPDRILSSYTDLLDVLPRA